jgi:Na+-transporting NADH:ubiquinone oxidoreductase subunit NqrB
MRYIYDVGFVKGLLITGLLLVSPIYNEVIFASFFNCLMTRIMSFRQNIKLLNTCFIYGILYILISQPTLNVLMQVFIRMLNVCNFTA